METTKIISIEKVFSDKFKSKIGDKKTESFILATNTNNEAKNNNKDQSTPLNICSALCLEKIRVKPPPTRAIIGIDKLNNLPKKNPTTTKQKIIKDILIFLTSVVELSDMIIRCFLPKTSL